MKQTGKYLPKYFFGWKGGLALFFGAVIPTVILTFANVFSIFFLKKNFQYNDAYLVVMNAVMWIGAIAAFDFFVCRPQTGKKLNFNFSPKNFTTYLFIFPLMFGMILIAEFLTGQIPVTGPFFGPMYDFFSKIMETMSKDTATMLLLACFMAPIFEEIVFRGIIQKGLINKGMKPIPAIWFSAVVFGMVHGNPWQFVGAVLLGYVLGLVYYRTKSLLMPILLHAFNNLLSTILIFYTGQESFSEITGLPQYVMLIAGVVIFAVFFYLLTKKYEIAHSE